MQRSKSYFSSGQCKSSLSLFNLEGGAGPWSSGAVNSGRYCFLAWPQGGVAPHAKTQAPLLPLTRGPWGRGYSVNYLVF